MNHIRIYPYLFAFIHIYQPYSVLFYTIAPKELSSVHGQFLDLKRPILTEIHYFEVGWN